MTWHPWGQLALVALVVIAVIVNVVLVHREVGRHDEHSDGIAQLWTQRDDDAVEASELHDLAVTHQEGTNRRLAELERWKVDIEAAIAEYMDSMPSTGRHAHKGEPQ